MKINYDLKRFFGKQAGFWARFRFVLVFCLMTHAVVGTTPSVNKHVIFCTSADQIVAAMGDAEPGDEIVILSGTYTATNKTQAPDNRGKWARFVGVGNGEPSNPIIVRGYSSTSRPVLQGPAGEYNGYTMRIVGDYWVIKDLEITQGSKGLVLDRSDHCEVVNVLVHDIGDEGIHIRDGSSNNLVDSCEIFNTGVEQPNYGEGLYVGSDKGQHSLDPNSTDYNPYCFDNTIQNCEVGPYVRAEGADIKEGTKNTIIRDCTFSGEGISGANSADAFIDLKGAYGFVYNNTFNVDGSSIIAAGIDILDRGTGDNTGYRNAIFDNVFNLGSGNDDVPGVRFKQGDPMETHYWDNTRMPYSLEPEGYWTDDIIFSCPTWNIVSCDGGGLVNRDPSVSITSPDYNDVFETGSNITFKANATDSDGTVVKVEFYLDGVKIGEDISSPYSCVENNLSNGTYSITAKATDNEGATATSTAVQFDVESAVSVESPYAYGIIPSNTNVSDAEAAYVTLIDNFYEDCGNGKGRIRWGLSENSWEAPDETVSEGIAYGLLLSAYYNDQATFNGLWNYYKAFPNQNGFMHWHTQGCNTVLHENGATDSDQDAAMALIVADKVFGSSGSVNYASEARDLIALIKQYEVESGTYTLKPGDAFGGSDITNISYFATGAYKLFGQFTNDEVFWNNVVDRCYEIIDNNLEVNNAEGGLVSDWCKADGTQANGKTLDYFYDACRTPWRIATDYIWFGDERAKNYLDKTNYFVQNTISGIQNVKDGYQQNGSLISGSRYHNSTFVSTFATAGVALSMQSEFNIYYTEIENTPPVSYFDYMFDLFGRTMLAGLYLNPLEGGVDIIPVTSVSLNQNTASVTEGGALQLNETVYPLNATDKGVSWSSSNSYVASVNSSGLVSALSVGSSTIIVTTNDGAKTASCNVTVTEDQSGAISVEFVDAEQVPNVAENLFDGDTNDNSRWSAQVFPKTVIIDYGETKSITGTKVWTYMNRSYHYTIGISDYSSYGFTTVVDQSGYTSAQPISHSFQATNGRYLKLTVTGATGYYSNWVSINEIEIVEGGSSSVAVTGVELDNYSIIIEPGETSQLTETVLPSNASDKNVMWSSSNTGVATVNSSGLVTAINAGNATITVTTNDGAKTASCNVDVTEDNGGGCNFEPMATALPSINASFENIHVLGNGPDLSNIRKFSIMWNLNYNGLYVFSFNTKNGSPSWYVNMLNGLTHSFNNSQPSVSISGSGVSGVDGDYYAIMDGDNFVLDEYSGEYTLYFSNSSTPPSCADLKSVTGIHRKFGDEISLYPNPVSDGYVTVSGLNEINVEVTICNIQGKAIATHFVNENQNVIDVNNLNRGVYILHIKTHDDYISKVFNKL